MELIRPRDEHLFRLTDDTGIMQHSKFGVPDPRFGYTTDDNSRALIVATMFYRNYREEKYLNLIYRYSSFILNSQTPKGNFKNFMGYDRRFLEDEGSEDSFGRTIWALGYCISENILPLSLRRLYKELLQNALKYIEYIKSPRSKAYVILGLYYSLKESTLDRVQIKEYISHLSKSLVRQFRENVDESWKWFEDIMAYSNAILPLSLFEAYKALGEKDILDVALNSMEFLEKIVFRYGYFKPIGCKGWYIRGGTIAEYDEQPVEAGEMILLYKEAYEVLRDVSYICKAKDTFMWFHGKNSKKVSLIDNETSGCYDAITPDGVNLNQGAESLLSYLLAYFTMMDLLNVRKELTVV